MVGRSWDLPEQGPAGAGPEAAAERRPLEADNVPVEGALPVSVRSGAAALHGGGGC
jgi:hypothetical protein